MTAHPLRRIALTLPIVCALFAALALTLAWLPLRQAREAWVAGRDAEAIAVAQRWSRFPLWQRQYHQLLAAAFLTSGNRSAANAHLGAIGHVRFSAVAKEKLARRLAARAAYADFLAYDAASQEVEAWPLGRPFLTAESHESPEVAKYRAFATAAVKSGSFPYVFDRDGRPIAVWRLSSKDVAPTDDAFAAIVSREAGTLTVGTQASRLGIDETIDTTLDSAVQRAAVKALGNYRGAIVAIDPRTNELLAVVSTRGSGALTNIALERQYEPGSVVKVLTGLNALTNGVDVAGMFPYVCKGTLQIDGRHFGDWLPSGHDKLKSIDDALAVSCNVYFADLGLRLGRDRLRSFMTGAGFDGEANLALFQVPLGKTVGAVFNNFETALYAIGLEHESINALHLAMLASMMANRGVLTTPRLLRSRRSMIGEVVAVPPPQRKTRIGSAAAAETMIGAMQAVASEPRGTGRRAPVSGISLAMKTGTAGDQKSGLEALIMAFAPVESPKIAFAVIAEDAGPAEFAGARIAHDFLEALKPRL